MADIKGLDSEIKPYTGKINLEFNGSAGQSFEFFQTKEVNIKPPSVRPMILRSVKV